MSYEVFGDNDHYDDDWPERAAEHGWYSPDDLSAAEKDVIRERARQVDLEGFDLPHDDQHAQSELAWAAACYALAGAGTNPAAAVLPTSTDDLAHALWPWELQSFKPKDRRSDLVRATALLIAEIERLDRVSAETKGA